ncbi:hypothetical protein [Streptomyces sp. SID3212]|uniref:hypothetical protein n=1 Tax=Streptomyces sp. SID3212 TaxID=2690259 RepID=UPI00136D7EB1|nr:hypothetical protein [Streptomyces sp. SID3212]MYV58009.1 hypothetical protein [Streptomyces sp. SID3212]
MNVWKGKLMPKPLSALRRFAWEYRVIKDDRGNDIGYAIPPESDSRTPRKQQCGRDTAGFVVAHTGRNRERRRELGRQYGMRILPATNVPHVGKIRLGEIEVQAVVD